MPQNGQFGFAHMNNIEYTNRLIIKMGNMVMELARMFLIYIEVLILH